MRPTCLHMHPLLPLVPLLLLAPGCEPSVGDSAPYHPDADGDGYSSSEGDCDDGDADRHPGLEEIPYDGVDNDCDEATLDDDLDGDGYGVAEDCDDEDPDVNPEAMERADGVDNNCDGEIDEEVCFDGVDNDGDGLLDCEDGDCFEDCIEDGNCGDGIDNDADGLTDCEDDECWIICGAPAVYWVTGGRLQFDIKQARVDWAQTSIAMAFDGYQDTTFATMRIDSVWGTLHFLTAQDSAAQVIGSCQWSVPGGTFTRFVQRSEWSSTVQEDFSRLGPYVDGSCPRSFDQPWFPGQLVPFRWGAHGSGFSPHGHAWYYQPTSWYVGHALDVESAVDIRSTDWAIDTHHGQGHVWKDWSCRTTWADVSLGSGGFRVQTWEW